MRTRPTSPAVESTRSALRISLVAVVFFTGCLLRCVHSERIAIDHFDEGVYASNIWFDAEQGFAYPMRQFYAPPFLPLLIEYCLMFARNRPDAPTWPGLVLGSLMPAVVFWIGTRAFGWRIGLIAATLGACSDLHILYSRTALTDVPATFFMMVAVGLFLEACRRDQWQLSLVAGAITGLAWWTKYNGWLPLAVTGSGALAFATWEGMVGRGADPVRLRRLAGHWLAMATAALLAWLPLFWSLGGVGGYAAITANHRQYVVGWSGWLPGVQQQLENLRHLEGGLGALGLTLAVGIAAVAWHGRQEPTRNRTRFLSRMEVSAAALLVPLFVVAWWLGPTSILGLLVLVAGAVRLVSSGRASKEREPAPLGPATRGKLGERPEDGGSNLATWCLIAGYGGLLIATPLYRPYSRLLLPWVAVTWLLGAVAVDDLVRRFMSSRSVSVMPSASARAWMSVGILGMSGLAAVTAWICRDRLRSGVAAWQDRTGMASHAATFAREMQRDRAGDSRPFVVWVYGEPAMFFHLRAAGVEHVQPIASLSIALSVAPQARGYIVVGPHAERSESFRAEWKEAASHFRRLVELPYSVSDFVRLDSYAPDNLERSREDRIGLFLIDPPNRE